MLKNIFIKTFIITLTYYLCLSILTIVLYLTLGEYIVDNNSSLLDSLNSAVYILMIGIYVYFLKKDLKSIDFKKIKISTFLYLALLLVLFRIGIDPLYRAEIVFSKLQYPESIKNQPADLIGLINLVILAPIIEELVFRGYILQKLKAEKIKDVYSVFYSSVLFSLIHLNLYPFDFDVVYYLNSLIVGFMLGIIYLRYNLLYSVLFHMVINLIATLINTTIREEYWSIIKHFNFNIFYWLIVVASIILLVTLLNRKKVYSK